ncbi:unnamed protein product, partial [marine sediment metagenome]
RNKKILTTNDKTTQTDKERRRGYEKEKEE